MKNTQKMGVQASRGAPGAMETKARVTIRGLARRRSKPKDSGSGRKSPKKWGLGRLGSSDEKQ